METTKNLIESSQVETILKEYMPAEQFEPETVRYVAETILEDTPNNVLDMENMLSDYLTNEITSSKEEVKQKCKEIYEKMTEMGYKYERKAIIAKRLEKTIKLSEVQVGSKSDIVNLVFDPKSSSKKKGVIFVHFGTQVKTKEPVDRSKKVANHLEELKKLRQSAKTVVCHDRDEQSTRINISCFGFDITIGGKTLFENADLKINFGRKYCLVGRNGIGKTTLLNHIARKEIPGIPSHLRILHIEQTVVSNDTPLIQELLNCDEERIQLLEEEQLITRKLENASEEEEPVLSKQMMQLAMRLGEIEADAAEYKAASILRGLGFKEEDLERPTKTFSGGWRMRINLAKALFCEPDLLLLDEPTNHLDMNAVMWLESYLLQWPYTVVIVSHAKDFINNIATDIINISRHKLEYWKGNYEAFEKNRGEKIKMLSRQKAGQDKKIEHIQKFIDKFRSNAKKAASAQSKMKQLAKMERVEQIIADPRCIFIFPTPDPLNPPILRLDACDLGYEETKILDKISLHVDMSSRIAIVGPNGAGKTTLLKGLTGELKPFKGLHFKHGKLKLGMFTQHHIDQLNLELSPVEQIEMLMPEMTEQEVRAHLSSFGVSGNLALRPNYLLSGGQKTRVAFACLVLDRPQVIVMDEPTNHLDIDAVEALAVALRNFTGGIVIVSHDQHFVEQVCDQIYIVQDQKCTLFKGTFEEYKDLVKSERK